MRSSLIYTCVNVVYNVGERWFSRLVSYFSEFPASINAYRACGKPQKTKWRTLHAPALSQLFLFGSECLGCWFRIRHQHLKQQCILRNSKFNMFIYRKHVFAVDLLQSIEGTDFYLGLGHHVPVIDAGVFRYLVSLEIVGYPGVKGGPSNAV